MMSTANETLGARIREARTEKRLTQQELAGRMNISVQSVSQWETNRTQPTNLRLFDLAEILGVEVQWLQKGLGDRLSPKFELDSDRKRFVREYRWPDIQSIGIFGSDLPPDDEIRKDTILAQKPAVRQLFAARISEDDNAPLFSFGDLVIADTGVKARPGDFVFVELGHEDQAVFRQLKSLRRHDDGGLAGELHPINPDYPVEQIVIDDNRDRIIGVMVEHRRFRRD
jgi:transcriptional regulator with XRE-family HTH domain